MSVKVTGGGAKLPMFIPCLNNCCPEKMALINYDGPDPMYRCRREGCEFREHPKPAKELTYWHRDPDKKRPHKEPDKESWDTAVV